VEVGGLNLGAGLGLSGLSFGSSSPLASPLQPGDGSFGGKSRSVRLHSSVSVRFRTFFGSSMEQDMGVS
jgi:hypothetical protein